MEGKPGSKWWWATEAVSGDQGWRRARVGYTDGLRGKGGADCQRVTGGKGSYRISRTSCCKGLWFLGVQFCGYGALWAITAHCGLGERMLFPYLEGQSPRGGENTVCKPAHLLCPQPPETLIGPILDTGDSQMNVTVLDPQVPLARNPLPGRGSQSTVRGTPTCNPVFKEPLTSSAC